MTMRGTVDPSDEEMDYSGIHQKPDDETVVSFMHAYPSGIHSPTDRRREENKLSPYILEGVVARAPKMFFPPRRLLEDGGATIRQDQALAWQQMANLTLSSAQDNALTEKRLEGFAEDRKPWLSNLHLSYGVGNDQRNCYFDVDPSEKGADRLASEVQELVDEIKGAVEKALRKILSDRDEMKNITKSTEAYRKIVLQVVFRDVIRRIDFIRSRCEKPDDVKKFYAILKTAAGSLGFSDIEIEALSSEDAVIYGCEGLYVPGSTKNAPKICIPMTRYGTNEFISIDKALEILAHELGHHAALTKPVNGQPSGDHDLLHAHHEHEIAAQLQGMRFDWATDNVAGRRAASKSPTANVDSGGGGKRSWWRSLIGS